MFAPFTQAAGGVNQWLHCREPTPLEQQAVIRLNRDALSSAVANIETFTAYYVNVDPGLPVVEHSLTVRDVPVDAFWSISVHNAEGCFADNGHRMSVNSLTATPHDDGSVTVHFGGSDNRPHPEVLNGLWTFPSVAQTTSEPAPLIVG
jgi:hypothetical protein